MSSEIRRRIKTLTGLFSLRYRNVKSAMTEWTVFSRARKLEGELRPQRVIFSCAIEM